MSSKGLLQVMLLAFCIASVQSSKARHLSVESLTIIGPDGEPLISLGTDSGLPVLELRDKEGRLLVSAGAAGSRLSDREGPTSGNAIPTGELLIAGRMSPLFGKGESYCRLLSDAVSLEQGGEELLELRHGVIAHSDGENATTIYPGVCFGRGEGGKSWRLSELGAEFHDKEGHARIRIVPSMGSIQFIERDGTVTVIP